MLKGPYRTKVLISETDIQMAQSLVYKYLKGWKIPRGNRADMPYFFVFYIHSYQYFKDGK